MSKETTTNSSISALNIDQTKIVLRHIINNNRFLQKQNKKAVAINIVGEAGLGKTSLIEQIAEEYNIHLVKKNLAQLPELGDLMGFPTIEYELKHPDKEELLWIGEKILKDFTRHDYRPTGNKRMGYCLPDWIVGKEEGGILLLDDWTRANPQFIQAVMELIDRQTYGSWKLPNDWYVILTSNPDNGDYNVSSIDNAQKTRFVSVELKFDIKSWSVWAEYNQIDSRCINFLMNNKELVSQEINPRSITTFFNSISSIPDFETSLKNNTLSKDLSLISMIGGGNVGPEFTRLFIEFINNKLDKLPSPEDILLGKDEDKIMKELRKVIDSDNDYRADIAWLISTRISNYCGFYSKNNKISKDFLDRVTLLLTENVFTVDLKNQMAREINSHHDDFGQLFTGTLCELIYG